MPIDNQPTSSMNIHTRLLSLLLPFLALLCGANRTAAAIDDRDNIAPTLWQIRSGQSFNDIGVTVAAGFRIVDIKLDLPGATTFTVTYVHNSGAYGTAWWYLLNVDQAGLSNFISQNSVRITKVIAWDGGGAGTRYAAVMVPNTGANYKPWWWYAGVSVNTFFNFALTNGARPVSLDEYRIGATDYCVGAMVANTGNDYKPWWLYIGQSFANIGTLVAQNQARLWSMQQNPGGTFNCIMVRDNIGPWWYLGGVGGQQLLDFAANVGARVFDLQTVGSSYYAVLLRNDNDLERRVGDIMRAASDGTVGVYLKRVGGPVLASLQGDRQFEPASTIKTLIHYHAMDQVRLANAALGNLLTVYTGTSGSCPQTTSPISETLSVVLRQMMENSDNNRTLAAETRFGRANINATALVLGMAGTSINHTLGCGGPTPNRLTLSDLGRLHEAVANNALGTLRTTFYDLMLQFPDSYAGGELNTVLTQEAASVGLTGSQLTAFRANCVQAFKGGSYTFLGPTREYRSWGTWISLPFYTSAGIVAREYVTGSFVDAASNGTNASTAFNRGAAEVLRDEIHAAMLTWRNQVFGTFTSFGLGCLGSNGVRPVHAGTPAVPNIGMTVNWSVSSARPSALTALAVGFSNTNHGSFGLPLDLASYGMPTCRLYTEVINTLYATTSSLGQATISSPFPNSTSLINLHVYSQFLVFDPGSNPLGIAWSNAMNLMLGGQP